MPPHVLVAVITLAVAAVSATLAIIYSLARSTRKGLRCPLVAVSAAACTLAIITGKLGSPLLAAVKATGSPAEIAAAQEHAHGSDALTVALFTLLVVVLATIWKALNPRKEGWNASATIGATFLGLAAIVVIITGGVVLLQALQAVTAGHPTWTVRS
jgi:hypothetical protein